MVLDKFNSVRMFNTDVLQADFVIVGGGICYNRGSPRSESGTYTRSSGIGGEWFQRNKVVDAWSNFSYGK